MLALIHPFVDACSVAVLLAGGNVWERWLVYNLLAFAMQLPIGVWLDRRAGFLRLALLAGCLLVAVGVSLALLSPGGWPALCAVCMGNALFHLAAGKQVLDTSRGRSGPIGFFISTGALGLAAGAALVEARGIQSLVPVAMVLIALGGWAVSRLHFPSAAGFIGLRPSRIQLLLTLGLFLLVVWRSWAGMLAQGMTRTSGAVGVAAAIWAGKALGGYACDWLRGLRDARFDMRWPMIAASVAGSALLCFACSPEWVPMWIVLLFVAQLATGPVLSLMVDSSGGRTGGAFGLNCLGLFAGSVI